jgi:hypothetical protein
MGVGVALRNGLVFAIPAIALPVDFYVAILAATPHAAMPVTSSRVKGRAAGRKAVLAAVPFAASGMSADG